MRRVIGFSIVITGVTLAGLTLGCAPVTPSSAPAGRGASTPVPPPGPEKPKPVVIEKLSPSTPSSAVSGLIGKDVTIHLSQASPSLSPGPRRDTVKGTIKTIDSEWVVLNSEGRVLYIPRTSVQAIESQ